MMKNMIKKRISILLAGCMALLLGGCMYPGEQLQQSQIPYEDNVKDVEEAVDAFRRDNGNLLPIVTKEEDTDYYIKYIIDFKKIVPRYLAEIPGNAYEEGGVYQYTIVNEEDDPTVKLIDLRMAETIRSVKLQIDAQGYPALAEEIGPGVYKLDYKKMGFDEEPVVRSPYSGKDLHLVMSGKGEIYVDYTPDLYDLLAETEQDPPDNTDIRSYLVEDAMFVPAYSLPYAWDKKEKKPVYMSNQE
jgi:hypothetical protein